MQEANSFDICSIFVRYVYDICSIFVRYLFDIWSIFLLNCIIDYFVTL